MEQQKRRGLSALDLKIIAVVSMFIDHMGYTLFPGVMWLRCIGRLAFPIFAFQVAEGAVRTRRFGSYLGRMLLFAVVAEVPFNLMCARAVLDPYDQNVMWTLSVALAAIGCIRWAERREDTAVLALVWLGAAGGGFLLAQAAMTDYGGWGVMTVLAFYLCRDKRWGWPALIAAMAVIHSFAVPTAHIPLLGLRFPVQALALLALVLIALYDGRQGPHSRPLQYVFYAFYPVHILILALIAMYLR
ncbi:MAG: conjugal transfer protein TraX [Ruminococcaceae bacterium]|nr:conjugal transfer protein TraX [Oscillospiraceae bacterium]